MLPPEVLGSHRKVLSRGGTGSSLIFPQTSLTSSGGEVERERLGQESQEEAGVETRVGKRG